MASEDVLHKVITSVPVDSTAARVTSRGQHWEPRRKVSNTHFTECPELRQPLKSELENPGCWQNLTGLKYGLFTVVGIYSITCSRGARWVVRCLCGDYELRTVKAIKNPKNQHDRCDKCMSFVYLKRAERFRRTGDYGEYF